MVAVLLMMGHFSFFSFFCELCLKDKSLFLTEFLIILLGELSFPTFASFAELAQLWVCISSVDACGSSPVGLHNNRIIP